MRFTFEPAQVMALLRSRIVGQEAVLVQVEGMLKVVKADIKFLDKAGAEQYVSYKKLSDACMSQN